MKAVLASSMYGTVKFLVKTTLPEHCSEQKYNSPASFT